MTVQRQSPYGCGPQLPGEGPEAGHRCLARVGDHLDANVVRACGVVPARGKKPGRPPERTKRQLIDGIRWRVRAGAPWRDVPPAYGPWQTVYGLLRR